MKRVSRPCLHGHDRANEETKGLIPRSSAAECLTTHEWSGGCRALPCGIYTLYSGKLFTGQDIKGTNKSYNDLKSAYQITILAKEKFLTDNVFFHTFEHY